MNARWVFSLFVVLILLLVAAGCTQTTPPPATPVPTAVETTEIPTPTPVATTADSLTPGPTQTLQDAWGIEVQVASNGVSIDPLITVTCVGGKGLNVVTQIDVKVTRSDGVVETGIIARPLFKGKSISLRSTTAPGYKDRCEVWAYSPQGDKVKIYDAYVPFRTYN